MNNEEFQKYADMLLLEIPIPNDVDLSARGDEGTETLAHLAATYGQLPADFDQWELLDSNGNTVAHNLAKSWDGQFPDDFEKWDLLDGQGKTVGEVALAHGYLEKKQSAKMGM